MDEVAPSRIQEKDDTIPVIFIPRAGASESRQRVAERLLRGLLQDETFLRILQEIHT